MATRGAYNTRQKAQILDYLSEHKQQRLGVDELTQSLNTLGQTVGKTTVYRHLEAMSEQGEVRKYVDASGVTCYQYLEDTSACKWHAHLVCNACGELIHLDCGAMQSLSGHLEEEHGFLMDIEKTILYGCCARCSRKGES